MKLKIKIAILSLLALSFTALAQSNSIPQSIADVSGSVTKWLTSFDTNSTTFSGASLELWTAANYQKGINTSMELGVSYDVWKPVSVEAVFRNIGVGGDLVSYAGGIGYSIVKYDVKITGYLDGGVNQFDSRSFAEFGVRFKKSLAAHTYTFLGIGLQKEFGSHAILTPTITAGAGVTF